MIRFLLLAAVVFGSGMTIYAMVDRPEPYDVPYYKAHPAMREMMLSVCHKDAGKQRPADCENAEAASAIDIQAANGKLLAYMYDPTYWHDNPFTRDVVIAECARRMPNDEMVLPLCDAARRGHE